LESNSYKKIKNVEKEKYRDEVLQEIAILIDKHPTSIASALKHSNTFFKYPYSKKDLVDAASYAIINNRTFQKNIAVAIAYNKAGLLDGKTINPKDFAEFSNLGGSSTKIDNKKLAGDITKTIVTSTAQGAEQGGWIGAIIGAVAGIVNGGFQWGSADKDAKAQEEVAKAKIYAKLFDKDAKKGKNSWIPMVVVASVLLAGGIVVFFTLKEK
jgi:hypothetical protein